MGGRGVLFHRRLRLLWWGACVVGMPNLATQAAKYAFPFVDDLLTMGAYCDFRFHWFIRRYLDTYPRVPLSECCRGGRIDLK